MTPRKSKILAAAKEELAAAHERMNPEERLVAFAEHSKWLIRLMDVGAEYRKSKKPEQGHTEKQSQSRNRQ